MDAYLLSKELPQMRAIGDYTTQGATGKLSADSQCVINRQIDWGKFTADGIQPE